MEFIIKQICKIKDISTCLDLYEDISYMDLALKIKTIDKLECIIEELINYNIDKSKNFRKKMIDTSEESYMLEVSLDISNLAYCIIDAIEDGDTLILKKYYKILKELYEKIT